MFCDNIVFKHPVALIYLLYTYFCLKCNLFSIHPSSCLHVSSAYGHHQVLSILLKLLHWKDRWAKCVESQGAYFEGD
jgi:hypothetical protein